MKKDWEIKKLGDLVTQINGLWKGKKEPFINVAVIRNTNFSKDCKLKLDDVEYLDVELKQYSSRKLQAGDIIIEKSGGSDKQPVGRPILFNIEDGEYSFSNFTSTLRIKDVSQVSAEYLQQYLYFRWLNGDTRNLQSHTTGIHNLDFKAYLNFDIILPPLEEQKRIVKILDEKFAQLESLKANAQTNLQNSKDLFQSEFVNIFNKANTVRMITVETVCSSIVDCPHSTPKWITNGKLCLRTTNFKPNQIDLSTKYYVSDETYNERVLRLKPQPGDIVFSREGGILGIACMIPNGIYPCLGQRMMLLRPRKETDNRFLMYYLNSPMIEKIIKSKILGAAAPHINVADVKSFPIPEFPLSEQKRIVKELDALSEKVRQLQEIYTKQIANCDELKQAYLQKAFEGEL